MLCRSKGATVSLQFWRAMDLKVADPEVPLRKQLRAKFTFEIQHIYMYIVQYL